MPEPGSALCSSLLPGCGNSFQLLVRIVFGGRVNLFVTGCWLPQRSAACLLGTAEQFSSSRDFASLFGIGFSLQSRLLPAPRYSRALGKTPLPLPARLPCSIPPARRAAAARARSPAEKCKRAEAPARSLRLKGVRDDGSISHVCLPDPSCSFYVVDRHHSRWRPTRKIYVPFEALAAVE